MDRNCIECGEPIPKGRYSKTCCLECGMKAMRNACEQIHNMSGPYYDRWLQGCSAAVGKYRRSSKKAASRYKESVRFLQYNTTAVGVAEQIIRTSRLTQELEELLSGE